MKNLVSQDDFDLYLNLQGYTLLEKIEPSSRLVNLARKGNQKMIIKRDYPYCENQTITENEILEKLKGLERLPKKITFENNFIKNHSSSPFGLCNYFLAEQYIDGDQYDYEQLSTNEEQKLKEMIETFHKEGYSRLDLERSSNFILTPFGELYLVDLGFAIQKDNPQFDFHVKKDLSNLEDLLKQSLKN
ncbi:MAG TPA: hypothetical protein HA284_03275 [Nanoarchaeota archaeon]|nr:hypothetical protein [Nanoarchaeota archaeon]